MNLLFVADRNYLDHIYECISSIIRFPSVDGYDIYIMHSDWENQDEKWLSDRVRRYDVRCHVRYVDPKLFQNFPENRRYPRLIYYRILAALLLPQHLDRILYLDGDTIIINSLEILYNLDFDGNYFLSCTHVRKGLNKFNQYRLGMYKGTPYINSGVLLMNLIALRRYQNISEVEEYIKMKRRYLVLPDQDIISALYGQKIGLLDTMKYNLSDRMVRVHNFDFRNKKIRVDWVRENTVIIHYCGKQKPWKKRYFGILDVFYIELKEGNSK